MILPAREAVVQALNALREKNRRARVGAPVFSGQSLFSGRTGREMQVLGRLIHKWTDIVGPDLARHTVPSRLFNRSLHLICSDSQWLHTLNFVKDRLTEKIIKLFPDMKIDHIQTIVGIIPDEVLPPPTRDWPDWHVETSPDLPASIDPNLREVIERLAKKTKARIKGLETEGYVLCPECQAVMITADVDICAVCISRKRQNVLVMMRTLQYRYPWLRFSQVREKIPEAIHDEWQLIREELLNEARQTIERLGGEIRARRRRQESDDDLHQELIEVRREIIRAVRLAVEPPPRHIFLNGESCPQYLTTDWWEILHPSFQGDEGNAC